MVNKIMSKMYYSEMCLNLVKADVVGVANRTVQLGFGRYDIQSGRVGCLSYRAIEAARRARIGQFHRAMSRQFRRNGKIWVRVLSDSCKLFLLELYGIKVVVVSYS